MIAPVFRVEVHTLHEYSCRSVSFCNNPVRRRLYSCRGTTGKVSLVFLYPCDHTRIYQGTRYQGMYVTAVLFYFERSTITTAVDVPGILLQYETSISTAVDVK